MREGVANPSHIKALMKGAFTDKINDCEMFMDRDWLPTYIDYSYYSEKE